MHVDLADDALLKESYIAVATAQSDDDVTSGLEPSEKVGWNCDLRMD